MIGVDVFTEALRWFCWLVLSLIVGGVVCMIFAAVMFEGRKKTKRANRPKRAVYTPCERCNNRP